MWPAPDPYLNPADATGNPEIYGLPYNGNATLFFFNRDLAKKYGINPDQWTWDDVMALAEKVKENEKDIYPFVLRSGGGNSALTDVFPLLFSSGGNYFNEDWTSAINSKAGLEAFKYWVNLFQNYAPPEAGGFGSSDVQAYLEKGKAAMAIAWPNNGLGINVPKNIGITVVPGIKQANGEIKQIPEVGEQGFAIPKNSAQPEAALDFMKWITEAEQQKQYGATAANIPTRTDVLTDEEMLKQFPWWEAVYQSLEKGHLRPRTPAWPQAELIMGNWLVKAELNEATPEKAVDKAAQEVNDYMKQNGFVK